MSEPRASATHGRPPRRARGGLWWVLIVAFVALPLLEIYVIIQVGQVIGAWWTLALLVLDSIIGGWLVKREGARAWRALREALSAGRMPAGELADAALILIGGTLMLTPGFVSDVVGIVMILPLTRPLFRLLLATLVARRITAVPIGFGPRAGGAEGPWTTNRPGPGTEGPVVRGDVIDDSP